eukprot:7381950-Prymnesium_polylepis.1
MPVRSSAGAAAVAAVALAAAEASSSLIRAGGDGRQGWLALSVWCAACAGDEENLACGVHASAPRDPYHGPTLDRCWGNTRC